MLLGTGDISSKFLGLKSELKAKMELVMLTKLPRLGKILQIQCSFESVPRCLLLVCFYFIYHFVLTIFCYIVLLLI